MKEGVEALNLLAHSPQTAHFISWKIAQRFVADDPPPALVDRMAKTFLSSDGDIKAVLRTLVESSGVQLDEVLPQQGEDADGVSGLGVPDDADRSLEPWRAGEHDADMGMPLYYALPPTGYYITADKWMNTGALVDRLNFAYQLTNGKFANQKFDAAKVVALGLMSEQAMPAQVAVAKPARPA